MNGRFWTREEELKCEDSKSKPRWQVILLISFFYFNLRHLPFALSTFFFFFPDFYGLDLDGFHFRVCIYTYAVVWCFIMVLRTTNDLRVGLLGSSDKYVRCASLSIVTTANFSERFEDRNNIFSFFFFFPLKIIWKHLTLPK